MSDDTNDQLPDDETTTEAPSIPSPQVVDVHGMDAQQLAEALSPEELEELKNHQKEALANQLVEGRWLANCPGQKNIHVKAASQSEAVALVCLYLACEPQQVVVAQCKRKALPRRGDRVLRAMPVAGAPDKTGYAYGIEPPE